MKNLFISAPLPRSNRFLHGNVLLPNFTMLSGRVYSIIKRIQSTRVGYSYKRDETLDTLQ
jgi:hypothetical protein